MQIKFIDIYYKIIRQIFLKQIKLFQNELNLRIFIIYLKFNFNVLSIKKMFYFK